jgi:magnesium chelatase family protein
MSGPIVDRIDIWLEVDRVLPTDLSSGPEGEKSDFYKKKVEEARKIQEERFKVNTKVRKNAEMGSRDLVTHVALTDDAKRTLNIAAERLGFSPRVYHRMIKVARTIADLEGSKEINQNHILESLLYRPKKFDV